MRPYPQKWLKIAIINLCIVAFIGIVLRYKIVFSLPFINQKHLLHSHSHFAFTGWVSCAIMTLMVNVLFQKGLINSFTKYRPLLVGNLLCAYGMLFTFAWQGYGIYSISFSTLSIIISYLFAIYYWKNLNKLKTKFQSFSWFKAALVFNTISSLGAFSLAVLMSQHINHQNWYLASIFFFLHFQYNGWFLFACLGLIVDKFQWLEMPMSPFRHIFQLFFFAAIPAYFLSALWIPMPLWIYVIVVMAAIAQVVGLVWLIKVLLKKLSLLKQYLSVMGKWLFTISGIAFSIKILLQLGSVYPPLSDLAFGYRPIVIGYLHLVLLGMITIFLLGFIANEKYISMHNISLAGIIIFVFGVFINEILLMTQGLNALNFESVPYMNEMLLGAGLVMFIGLMCLVAGQFTGKDYNLAAGVSK